MKKLLQMKFMLLLCALIVGSGTMWADNNVSTVSTKFNATGDVTSKFTQTGNFKTATWNLGVTWKDANKTYWGDLNATKGTQIGSGSNPASQVVLTGSNIPGTISSVKVNTSMASGGTITVEVAVGGTAFKNDNNLTASLNKSATDFDFTGSGSGDVVITWKQASTSKAIYIKSITVTYVVASDSPLASITLSGDYPTSFTEGDEFSHEGMTVTATYEDESTADVTSSATFSGYDMTVLDQNQTVTVSYSEGEVTKTAEYSIIVNAIPTHSVTWSVNGNTQQESYKEGAAITFPAEDPADIEGKSFVGWTETAINGTTNTAPEFVSSATMGESNVTFYAVFATVEQGGENTYEVLSSNNFDANANYVIAAKQSATDATMWYFYSYGDKVDENASWGKMTTDPSTNAPITFTLSGTASELIVQANTGHYLKGLTTGNFQMSASSQKIALDENGNIKSSNNTGSYALRHNYNNGSGGLRWYNSTTGQPANFYKVIPGTTYSGYCTTVEARADAELSFAQAAQTAEVYFASQYTGQGLTNPHSVSPITWTSSNENVATVNENGTVTVIAVGETTITASFAGNGDYNAGEASYTLTVQDSRADAGISYPKNEETIELKVGDYDAIYHTSNPLTNPNSLTGFSWTSSNEDVATVNQSGVVTLKAVGETTITASFAGNINYKPGVASFTLQVVDNRQDATVTWKNADGNNITELNVEKGDFIQGITLSCNVEGFTFTEEHLQHLWGTNETHDNYAGQQPAGYIFTPNAVWTAALGITTITATFPGNETHKPASATLTVTVTGGTEKTPYTVAEARAAIDAGTGVTEVYATGIVSEIVTAFNSQYGNITYNISADGLTTSDQLQAYRGKSYNGNNFTSADDIQVGDVVIIYGNLKNHNNIYEFAESNQLYFNQPRLIVANEDKTVTVNAAGTITSHEAQTITINYRNFLETTPSANNVSVLFCDVNGTVAAESYDWIKSITFNENGNENFTMNCLFEANDGEARTGYVKVTVTVGNTIYYSDIITITQAAPVTSHNVTFSVNGTVTAPEFYEEGAAITFPEVSDIDGMTFLGWTDNEISGTQASANYVTEATMGDGDVTYYAVFALLVPGTSTTYTDELTHDLIGVTGTSYSNWSGITDNSGAVYAGNSAGGNTAIQLRSNSNSGIVTTASGGKLKKVTVEWNSNTADERTLDIYGDHVAYTNASELYISNQQGTKLGSISKNGTTMALSINGDYEYVGLRSNNGAMYLDKITIEWESGTPDSYTDYCTTIPEMLTVTIAEACTDGKGKYYGTYSSSSAFKVSGNVTVSEIGINNDGTMNVQSYEEGAVVPKNTGVMISAETYGDFKLIKSTETGTSVLDNANRLRPTGDGISAADMAANDSGCLYYRLTMHNGTKLGFWWGADHGAAFAVGPNKAYMAVPATTNAREGFAFDDDSTTGISNVNVNLNDNDNCYDLQGRKVSTPGKGLYIVNGKKVVIK